MIKKVILTLSLFIFILILPACPGEYKFSDIKLGDQKDKKTSLITNPQTVFEANTAVIYGQASFTNPDTKNPTSIQIIWNYTGNGEDVPVNSNTINTNLSGTIGFQSKRPGYNWQIGSYRIDFIINQKTYATYKFSIGDTGKQDAMINSVKTASQIDSSHNPVIETDTFSPTSKEIFLTIATSPEAPKNSNLKVEWWYTTDTKKINDASTTVGPNQKTHFTLDKQHNQTFLTPDGNWPKGNYRADIYLNQTKLKSTVLFEIK
ncbi:MAG: hypothetical protein ACOZAR_04140 [Patescibacteria group bacterium]